MRLYPLLQALLCLTLTMTTAEAYSVRRVTHAFEPGDLFFNLGQDSSFQGGAVVTARSDRKHFEAFPLNEGQTPTSTVRIDGALKNSIYRVEPGSLCIYHEGSNERYGLFQGVDETSLQSGEPLLRFREFGEGAPADGREVALHATSFDPGKVTVIRPGDPILIETKDGRSIVGLRSAMSRTRDMHRPAFEIDHERKNGPVRYFSEGEDGKIELKDIAKIEPIEAAEKDMLGPKLTINAKKMVQSCVFAAGAANAVFTLASIIAAVL